jgi:hypothetical protein
MYRSLEKAMSARSFLLEWLNCTIPLDRQNPLPRMPGAHILDDKWKELLLYAGENAMVCSVCGESRFDANGVCLHCGASAASDTVPRAPKRDDPTPVPVLPAGETSDAAAMPAVELPRTPPRIRVPSVALPVEGDVPVPMRLSVPLKSSVDPAATHPGSGVFCGRCGSAVDSRSNFCGICGNPLKDAALQQVLRERGLSRPLGTVHAAPDDSLGNPNATQPSSLRTFFSRLIAIIVAIVLVALVVGVTIGLWLLQRLR